jgi:Spy/CpxP family protein refolding chaperone
MKFVRFGLALGLLALLASPLFAQTPTTPDAAKPMAKSSSPMMSKSPEDMAKEQMAKWKDTLKITDEQAPKFEAIMTDSYKKMADARTAAAGDKAKMKASMTSIMKDRDAALAGVLTPDQMKTYQAKMKEMSNKAKQQWKKEGAEKSEKTDK